MLAEVLTSLFLTGRTGRFGKAGASIAILNKGNRRDLERLGEIKRA
jgi:superfamily II DNA/RNA helicase